MTKPYILTGTLTDERTVALDEAVPLAERRVRLVVEPLEGADGPRPYGEVVAAIRERQRRRDHRPPTRRDVDASIRAERESWGE